MQERTVVIKGSPFDLAGYTLKTKFRVVKTGDIVTLYTDDGTTSPRFRLLGSVLYRGRYFLPTTGNRELEVVTDTDDTLVSIEEVVSSATPLKESITLSRDIKYTLNIKGVELILTEGEARELYLQLGGCLYEQ